MSSSQSSFAFAVHAACIRGVEAVPVTVEVSMSGSIPGICIVGLGDASVLDARVRIRSALRASGFEIPRQNVTVNLAPGDMRKTGTGFDLPIMLAILAISGQIPRDGLDECLFTGEVALDGRILPMKGEVAYALLAREASLRLVGGHSNGHIPIEGVESAYIEHVSHLREGINGALRSFRLADTQAPNSAPSPDFSDVLGQEIAKRACAIAAAGGHGMLMIGAPGSGKTMLARRMTGILPTMSEEEQQEALCIHSIMGEDIATILEGERPFRSPHHSISAAGLIGGGRPIHPGEISLAHGGVLFLDELGEFPANVLQLLRQPIEQGSVTLVREQGSYRFPARFQLLAASNPCPCGYLGDRSVKCICAQYAISRYQSKLAGPLVDRIDMVVNITRPDPKLIVEGSQGLSSALLKEMVERGLAFKAWREKHSSAPRCSTTVSHGLDHTVQTYAIDMDGKECLLEISERNHLTGRGMTRLAQVARTIADIAEHPAIERAHMLEASMYQGRIAHGAI